LCLMLKKTLIHGLCTLGVFAALQGCDSASLTPTDLPWQVTASAAGNPQVFGVEVGVTTLKGLIEHLRSFPELAVFAHENGKRSLEAYFGTQRLGVFEAKLIAELQADSQTLNSFQQNATQRAGMASGMWKHTLTEADVSKADGLVINKLIYLPSIDYEPDIITARFGEPSQRLPTQQAGTELWVYPAKGLLLLYSSDGGEILYYTTPALYPALQQELLEAIPNNAQ
ncbi:MAG: hypothetical protein ACK4RS_03840, partial [Thiothrix sp.]